MLLNTDNNRGQGLDGKLSHPAFTPTPTHTHRSKHTHTHTLHSIRALSGLLFAFIEHGRGSPFGVNNVGLKSFHTTVLGHVS